MRHFCALPPFSPAIKRRGVSGNKTGDIRPVTRGAAGCNRHHLLRPEVAATAAERG